MATNKKFPLISIVLCFFSLGCFINESKLVLATNSPTLPPTLDCGARDDRECQPTASGACSGSVNIRKWRDGSPNGYQTYFEDLVACQDRCAETTRGCGNSFLGDGCDNDAVLTECVTNCMANDDPEFRELVKLEGPAYTENCAQCMGEHSRCIANRCRASCFSRLSTQCSDCQVREECFDDFFECSGVRAERPNESSNVETILIGVLSGCAVLFACVVFNSYESNRELRKKRNMGMEELSKMAHDQQNGENLNTLPSYYGQPQGNQVSPFASIPMPEVGQADGENQPISDNPEEMTPYQRQYLEQQRQLAQQQTPPPMPTNAPPPGLQSQAMQPLGAVQTTELRVLFDFRGQQTDELKVQAGTTIWGIEESEGWWLAKTVGGIIGLIPSNYIKVVDVFVPGGNQNEPTF